MLGRERQWGELRPAGFVGALLSAVIVAGLAAGCGLKGQGESCDFHRDCEAGLVCDAGTNTCTPCGSGNSCLAVELVVHSCVSEQSPFLRDSDLQFRIRVTGDDMSPIEVYERSSGSGLQLPEIPLGENRQLTVEAFKGGPDNVRARGSSMPFDVTPRDPLPKLGVYLRMVNEFTPMNDAENPTGPCEALYEPRSGHTATVLKDGRVLIVGGHKYDESGNKVLHKDAEILDPNVGHFLEGAPLNVPRTGHTATLLQDGRVLVTGGAGLINGELTALRIAEVWDPSRDTWTVHQMQAPRMRHAAHLLPDGTVLLTGGLGSAAGRDAATSTEIFAPDQRPESSFTAGPAIAARADHAIVALGDSRLLLVGGTSDGETALDTTTSLRVSGNMIFIDDASPTLVTPRPSPLALPLASGGGRGVLVLGDGDQGDWISLDGDSLRWDAVTPPGMMPRTGACSAAFQGGALVVGGLTAGGEALASAEVHRIGMDGISSPAVGNTLRSPRSNATCTTLADGSVLVLGGESVRDGKLQASGVAEVYQP